MKKSGYTILNIETGKVSGLSIGFNQLPLANMTYIELYSIESHEQPIKPEVLFSDKEYGEYLDFKDDDPSEYTPDIVSDFCIKNGINEEKRKIAILADDFEENQYYNYNKWENEILNLYLDKIQQQDTHYKDYDEEV